MNWCACMGPQGTDPVCPCRMRTAGLTPDVQPWTPEQKQQLKDAFVRVQQIEDSMHLKEALRLLTLAMIASCSCVTKTPDFKYHTETCRFRLISEAIESLQKMSANQEVQ